MYKTTKWTVATFCLVAVVFGWEAENAIQNTSTNNKLIFYATLVIVNKHKLLINDCLKKARHWVHLNHNKDKKGNLNVRRSGQTLPPLPNYPTFEY